MTLRGISHHHEEPSTGSVFYMLSFICNFAYSFLSSIKSNTMDAGPNVHGNVQGLMQTDLIVNFIQCCLWMYTVYCQSHEGNVHS